MPLEEKTGKIPISTFFPGLFTMIGCILIYINHGMNEVLIQLGFPKYYDFSIQDGFLRGLLLGVINFIFISFFMDQAIRKKSITVNLTRKFSESFFLEKQPREWEVYAHLTASINAAFYFFTCIIALLLTPGATNPNFIILTFGLGSVTSLSIWAQVFFYHYQFDKCCSIERLKTEHATWLELTRQFIFVGISTATGLVIYGVVNWFVNTPSTVSLTTPFQLTLFSLAATCIYIYVGFFLGVISQLLVFLGKICERIEEIDKSKNVQRPL